MGASRRNSINEQMHKQVNQSILVFFRCIVNVYCLVNIRALKHTHTRSNIMAYSFASGSSAWLSIFRYCDRHSDCIRLHTGAALRQQLHNSSLEQLTCISVDGHLLPLGLQKSYLQIQSVCFLCFRDIILRYLLLNTGNCCQELGAIGGKISPFHSYPLILLFTSKGRTLSWRHETFERGVFTVLVWNGLWKIVGKQW